MVEQAERMPPASPGAPQYLEQAMAWSDRVRATARCALDIPYGEDERQKLDVYMPGDASIAHAPVLMFMHGGYWVIGHKDLMGFMAPAITPAPAVLVSVGYRLAPGAKYPQQVDDCRAALHWVYDNIADYGGSRDRIHISGHSAGGHLAAMLTLQREQRNALCLPDDVIKACFPVSGVFDVADTLQDRREAFLRRRMTSGMPAPAQYRREHGPVPAGDRFRRFRQPARPAPSDAGCLRSQPGYVEEMVREGHNHFGISLDHADPNSPWIRRVREWMTG